MKKEEAPQTKEERLIEAAKRGDRTKIDALLFAKEVADRPNINAIDAEGMTAFLWVARNGKNVLMDLLEGAHGTLKTNMRGKDGATALILASENGHASLIETLITSFDQDINARDNNDNTALMKAAMNGHLSVVSILIDKDANPNLKNSDGLTALMAAAKNGQEKVVQYLVDSGLVNIDEQGAEGRTALMLAAMNKYPAVVAILLKAGALWELCDKTGLTVLDIAKNDLEMGKLIQAAIEARKQRQEQAMDSLRRYRNLIMIMEYGGEILDNNNAAILDLIAALQQPCAFILIPAPLWDHFMRAEIEVEESTKKINAKAFFDQTQWDMYKICLSPAEAQKADFYLLVPKEYAKQLKKYSTISILKDKLSELADMPPDEGVLNELNELGINLITTSKIDPYAECGELGKVLDTYNKPEQEKERRKHIIDIVFVEEFSHSKALACLTELMALKKAHRYFLKLKKKFEKDVDKLAIIDAALSFLPCYNVYLVGHGASARTPSIIETQLNSLLQRAREFGFWPGVGTLTLPSTSPAIQKFKADREGISEKFVDFIAGLTPRVFGGVLELLNGVTNFFTVSTCHGAGIHLALPFVFMNAPQELSYTLAIEALLHAPVTTSSTFRTRQIKSPLAGSLTGSITQDAVTYYYMVSLAFKKFFDGISNFPTFIKNEEQRISAAKRKTPTIKNNYFARLLNYVGNFLDNEGRIRDINHVPWVKLPGNTNWQVVSFLDDNAFFITDIMIRAKRLEEAPLAEGQRPLGEILEQRKAPQRGWECTVCGTSNVAGDAACTKCLSPKPTAKKQSPIISVPHNKNLIFVATDVVPLTLSFEKGGWLFDEPEPKSIIPLGKPLSLGLNVTFFSSIITQYDLNTLYKKILKPVTDSGDPLFRMPENTLFFINELKCQNGTFDKQSDPKAQITLKNCMVIFNVPSLADHDVYFMDGNTCYGIKQGASKNSTDLDFESEKDIEAVDLDKKLIAAFTQGRMDLVKILIKAGANAAVLRAKEEPALKVLPVSTRSRAKSLSSITSPPLSAQ
jgi:ankyrin repeat protein